jgi:transcriptional regulator with XRE-family HTH domain
MRKQLDGIYRAKIQHRIHFIPEWAERREKTQADIVEATGADKGTVSRWFSGTIPTDDYLIALARFLGADRPGDLFVHPDEGRLLRFLRGRSQEESQRIQMTLETAFPRRA